MLRRNQHIKQRHDIEHLAAVNQFGFFADLGWNMQLAKLVLQGHQAGAFARQNHDVQWF